MRRLKFADVFWHLQNGVNEGSKVLAGLFKMRVLICEHPKI
jgi:hypothetical protein